jgi:hypothetical protein
MAKKKKLHPNRIWAAIGAVRACVGTTEDHRIVKEAATRQDKIGEAARKVLS